MSWDPEVEDLLKRHGVKQTDIERMREFESRVATPKKSKKEKDSPLDFGDWTP